MFIHFHSNIAQFNDIISMDEWMVGFMVEMMDE
jgi:hypothetical protein